jgi:hypothetical protein
MSCRTRWMICTLLLCGPTVTACHRNGPCSCPPDDKTNESKAGPPIDAALVAFLSRARSAHHLADLREAEEPAAAVAALLSVTEGPIPGSVEAPPPEAREVIADTQARIADVQSRLLQFDAALTRLDSALHWVPDISYFRGHLFETRGLVEQRRAEHLLEQGNEVEARAAKSRAIAAFETSMQIQSQVIQRAADTPSGAPTSLTAPTTREPNRTSPVHSAVRGVEK